MPWNGSGTFNRIYSWVADKAAGLDISSTRLDTYTNDIATGGFGNCLTRDGQGQATANLPMANFRHTGVGNGVNRTDYAALGQVQDGLINWSTDTGSSTAYAIALTPALTVLVDGQFCFFRAANTNTTTTPTFAPSGLTAHTITKIGGAALALGDITALQECELRYNLANTRWELLNPSNVTVNNSLATTGDVKLTFKTTADTSWLLFDDGTFGSATSGSSNSNSALNQSLFTIFFNAISDANAPLFTSTGAGTTRGAQGTAAAAWAANCRMSLTKTLGRAIGIAGAGSGLTSRALGVAIGSETNALSSTSQIPQFTPSGTIAPNAGGLNPLAVAAGSGPTQFTPNAGTNMYTVANFNTLTAAFTGAAVGSASPSSFSIVQPETFLNAMVKQ